MLRAGPNIKPCQSCEKYVIPLRPLNIGTSMYKALKINSNWRVLNVFISDLHDNQCNMNHMVSEWLGVARVAGKATCIKWLMACVSRRKMQPGILHVIFLFSTTTN